MHSRIIIIIFILSIFIWLFPPIKQYKTKYFYFFLLLAFSDLSSFVLYKLFQLNSIYIYIFIIYLAFLSLLSKDLLKKYLPILSILFLIIIIFVSFSYNISINYLIFISINILIFIKILFTFITDIGLHKILKIFLIVFLLYELTVIFKFVNLIIGFTDSYSYYFITSVFEFFVGVFFSVFKEDNPRIVVKLKSLVSAAS